MSGSITQFLAEFSKTGVARTSHFDVLIPTKFKVDYVKLPSSLLTFRCEVSELPGRQLLSSDIKIYGPTYKTPYQNVYAETNLTFIETADMDVRVFFERWMDLIIDSTTNRIAYPDDYVQTIEVRQYDVVSESPDAPGNGGIAGGPTIVKDEEGKTTRNYKETRLRKVLTCTLIDAFPTNINQMTTQWNDDSIHRVQVTFFYRSYTLTQHALSPAPLVNVPQDAPIRVASFSGED